MRILYFTRDYTPHDHRFLSSLAESEHSVFSLRLERQSVQREDRPLPPQVTQVIWRGGRAPARWQDGLGYLGDLRRVIGEVKPDLIHAGPVPTVAFLAALTGFRPLVSMSWGSDLLRDVDQNRWQQWAAKYTLMRTAILLGDCDAVRQKAIRMGYPDDRIVLFPWGVDLQRFNPGGSGELRARQNWQDDFVLLSLRSWEPLYGVDVVVKAFIKASQDEPSLRLVLLGNGSQATLLRQMILSAGVEERVFFGGQVANQNLPDYYHSADLYLSASHSDGSSVSLMEALACSLPVLVSDIPGNLEWIESGRQGWTFPDGDSEALAERILQAVRSKALLKKMGSEARQLAEQRADWKKNFGVMLNAYQRALNS